VAVIGSDKCPGVPESAVETTSKWDHARRFLDWFCGLDSSSTTTLTPKKARRLRDMTSLHQSAGARAALYTALSVLITLDLFLYGFFSTGSDFGLLRNGFPAADRPVGDVTAGNQSAVLLSHTVGM